MTINTIGIFNTFKKYLYWLFSILLEIVVLVLIITFFRFQYFSVQYFSKLNLYRKNWIFIYKVRIFRQVETWHSPFHSIQSIFLIHGRIKHHMYNKKIAFETLISLSQKVLIYWYWYFQYFLNFKSIEVLANQYFFWKYWVFVLKYFKNVLVKGLHLGM